MAVFQDNRVSQYQNVSVPDVVEARVMEVVVTTGAIRHANIQSSHHHQQTNTQKHSRSQELERGTCYRPVSPPDHLCPRSGDSWHPVFYRPDALPPSPNQQGQKAEGRVNVMMIIQNLSPRYNLQLPVGNHLFTKCCLSCLMAGILLVSWYQSVKSFWL